MMFARTTVALRRRAATAVARPTGLDLFANINRNSINRKISSYRTRVPFMDVARSQFKKLSPRQQFKLNLRAKQQRLAAAKPKKAVAQPKKQAFVAKAKPAFAKKKFVAVKPAYKKAAVAKKPLFQKKRAAAAAAKPAYKKASNNRFQKKAQKKFVAKAKPAYKKAAVKRVFKAKRRSVAKRIPYFVIRRIVAARRRAAARKAGRFQKKANKKVAARKQFVAKKKVSKKAALRKSVVAKRKQVVVAKKTKSAGSNYGRFIKSHFKAAYRQQGGKHRKNAFVNAVRALAKQWARMSKSQRKQYAARK